MKHYLWEMRPYFRQVLGQYIIGSVSGILMNTMVVLPPILLGRAIDQVLAYGRGEISVRAMTIAILAFVVGTLATELPRMSKRWWLYTAYARIRTNVRADLLRGVLLWPPERLQRIAVGELMARIIGDVDVLRLGVQEFMVETWDTMLFSLSLLVAMLIYDPGLTLLAVLPAPFAIYLAERVGNWVRGRVTAAREANAALAASLQEQLAGVKVLRLFGRSGVAEEHIASLSRRQAQTNLAVVRLRDGLRHFYGTLMIAGVLIVIWLGGQRVVAGAMTLGAFVAYVELYLRFANRAHRIPNMINSIQGGGAAYERLRPLLSPPLSVKGEPRCSSFRTGLVAGLTQSPLRPFSAEVGPISITLQEVTYRYPEALRPALDRISLDIPAGSLVAITGPVGCGKSALARILAAPYPLEGGTLLWNGRPLHDIPAEERAARVGYLPQDSSLLSGTVRENITFSAEGALATNARLAQSLHGAALEADLERWPLHLETQIGEGGVRASGGQRQRIALARALLAQDPTYPGLLVLDDPFSAVDVDTEVQIMAALRESLGSGAPPEQRATIVLLSHRLAAFPQADQVVVIDGGRIVEQGTHAELLAAAGLYARTYHAQR